MVLDSKLHGLWTTTIFCYKFLPLSPIQLKILVKILLLTKFCNDLSIIPSSAILEKKMISVILLVGKTMLHLCTFRLLVNYDSIESHNAHEHKMVIIYKSALLMTYPSSLSIISIIYNYLGQATLSQPLKLGIMQYLTSIQIAFNHLSIVSIKLFLRSSSTQSNITNPNQFNSSNINIYMTSLDVLTHSYIIFTR